MDDIKIIPKKNIKTLLLEECMAMIKYLAAEGKTIPKSVEKILIYDVETIDESDISNDDTIMMHKQLSQKISPAKPKSILLLYNESKKERFFSFLGPVGLVRRMMFMTLFSLVLFVGISLSSYVNAESLSKGILNNSGIDLFLNLFFIISSAALGGCFSNLFQANRFIINGTYDSMYESSYWIRFLLGIISGVMLAVIIPVATQIDLGEGRGLHLTIPLLAMVGGFSASLVHRIFTRIVWAIESLFVGKQGDGGEQKIANIQILHEQEKMIDQQNYLKDLMEIKSEMKGDTPQDELVEKIEKLMNRMVPGNE